MKIFQRLKLTAMLKFNKNIIYCVCHCLDISTIIRKMNFWMILYLGQAVLVILSYDLCFSPGNEGSSSVLGVLTAKEVIVE